MAGTSNSGGRNKLSTQAHILKGTFQSSRHGDHEAPEPSPGLPTRPAKLSGVAKAEWDRMIARLQDTGALSKVDDAVLYQYVCLYAETEAIQMQSAALHKLIADVKRAMKDLDGMELLQAVEQIVKLQQLLVRQTTQLRQGHMAIRQYLVEFGMTPAARTRVKLPPKKTQSKLDQFRNKAHA